jgi:hypothetical protein
MVMTDKYFKMAGLKGECRLEIHVNQFGEADEQSSHSAIVLLFSKTSRCITNLSQENSTAGIQRVPGPPTQAKALLRGSTRPAWLRAHRTQLKRKHGIIGGATRSTVPGDSQE